MCGRYLRRSDKQRIAEVFHVAKGLADLALPPWDYNVAPTTFQPVIRPDRDTGEREITLMRWGLIPYFAKDLKSFSFSTINARAESVSTSARPFAVRSSAAAACFPPTASTNGRSCPPTRSSARTPTVKPARKNGAEAKQPYAFTLAGGGRSRLRWRVGPRWKDPAGGQS